MWTHLPNAMTVGRIVLVPILVALFLLPWPERWWLLFGLFLLASITDLLDGHLARRFGCESEIGRFLDPIADKLLTVSVLFMLAATGRLGTLGALAALAIVLREVLIAGLREHLAGQGRRLPVSRLAKWKTTVQMAAIAALLLVPALPDRPWLAEAGTALLLLAALLTWVSGWAYLRTGIGAILSGNGDDDPDDHRRLERVRI